MKSKLLYIFIAEKAAGDEHTKHASEESISMVTNTEAETSRCRGRSYYVYKEVEEIMFISYIDFGTYSIGIN